MTISEIIGLDPLQTTEIERGIVSSRVALLLRSAEIQPKFFDHIKFGFKPNTRRAVARGCRGVRIATWQSPPTDQHAQPLFAPYSALTWPDWPLLSPYSARTRP
jgi:hypothetical protein